MIKELLIDLVYPRRCPVCDEPVRPYGKLICDGCRSEVGYIKAPYCMKCGKQLKEEVEYCRDCAGGRHLFDGGRALFSYRSISGSIYKFKYASRREYAEYFGMEIVRKLGNVIKKWKPDAIIPVPLHKKKLKARGFNQAGLIAEVIGREMEVPVYADLMERSRSTVPQKELNSKERQNNLKKAFKIINYDVKLKTVIIVDDIYTTGATIDALTEVLKRNGVKHVYFVTLSIGAGM